MLKRGKPIKNGKLMTNDFLLTKNVVFFSLNRRVNVTDHNLVEEKIAWLANF